MKTKRIYVHYLEANTLSQALTSNNKPVSAYQIQVGVRIVDRYRASHAGAKSSI